MQLHSQSIRRLTPRRELAPGRAGIVLMDALCLNCRRLLTLCGVLRRVACPRYDLLPRAKVHCSVRTYQADRYRLFRHTDAPTLRTDLTITASNRRLRTRT
ncbi:unnamed protein product [Chondrus crispus]|uniref:Uncharacterized protein n=1 Tax=Chondrus crispus TaxID=2769 RepID=R7QNL9_CHOCR|nr:unnamed protein product [Chondrus crispus]CDF39378.1 unnamed protein product [Chondrus crispus]|eukprot:XP_005719289.1 unnamed protein product [Chondrus crispus]